METTQLELVDFKELANEYYEKLTQQTPIKGLGSHEHIYFTYGIEWAYNRLQKPKEDVVSAEDVKGLKAVMDFDGKLNTYVHSYGSETLVELQQLWFKAIDAIQLFEHTNFTRNQPTDDRLNKVIDWCDKKIEENTVRDAPVYSEIRQSAYKEVKSFLQQLQP